MSTRLCDRSPPSRAGRSEQTVSKPTETHMNKTDMQCRTPTLDELTFPIYIIYVRPDVRCAIGHIPGTHNVVVLVQESHRIPDLQRAVHEVPFAAIGYTSRRTGCNERSMRSRSLPSLQESQRRATPAGPAPAATARTFETGPLPVLEVKGCP